jgi:hypothetical protein
MKTYNLKDLPIGTIVVFDNKARGVVEKAPKDLNCLKINNKSIYLTHYPSGWPWGDYVYGFMDGHPIVKITKPEKGKVKK